MSADTLTLTSRAFYERAKAKLAASIILGSGALMLLGFCSEDSGLSKSNNIYADNQKDDEFETAYSALASGYGFAAFCHILGFVLLCAAGIYVSPLICGYDFQLFYSPTSNCFILTSRQIQQREEDRQ
jgi:hypothetical protein